MDLAYGPMTQNVTVFGDISAVFRSDRLQESVLMAPMDTGYMWEQCEESTARRRIKKLL